MTIVGTDKIKLADLDFGYTLWTWTNPCGVKYCGILLPSGHVRQSMPVEFIGEVIECFRDRVNMGIYRLGD